MADARGHYGDDDRRLSRHTSHETPRNSRLSIDDETQPNNSRQRGHRNSSIPRDSRQQYGQIDPSIHDFGTSQQPQPPNMPNYEHTQQRQQSSRDPSTGLRSMERVERRDSGVEARALPARQTSYPVPDQRPAATPAATRSGLLAERVGSLDELTSEFCRYPLDDFHRCATLLMERPSILKEDVKRLQQEAIQLYTDGEDKLADQVVQRLVMLKHCKDEKLDSRGIAQYFNKLIKKDKTCYSKFRQGFGSVSDVFKLRAQASQQALRRPSHDQQDDSTASIRGGFPDRQERGYSASMGLQADQLRAQQRLSSHQPQRNPEFAPGEGNPMRPRPPSSYDQGNSGQRRPSVNNGPRPPPISRPIQQTMGGPERSEVRTAGNPTTKAHSEDKYTITQNQTKSYKGFEVVKYNAHKFFVLGKVIKIWHYTAAGRNLTGNLNTEMQSSVASNGHAVFCKPLFLLIVGQKIGYCVCCPIVTYQGQGLVSRARTGNPSLNRQEIRAHTIIYSRGSRPTLQAGEPAMSKEPIAVEMCPGQSALHPSSRIHFGKPLTVEWNIHVMEIGNLNPHDTEMARGYFINEMTGVSTV